ncbi:MAG TPA: Chromate resistance protein ChrB [Streptosporangiaceae bacterium]
MAGLRGDRVSWRVITYRLAADPSRHRVAIWRELRRLGAVPLQQGTWAVPQGEPFDAGLAQVIGQIEKAGGQPVVLTVADEEASNTQLEALFTAQREEEWAEFVSDCGKYEAELAAEVAKGKLTLAELDEEEQSLERLRRWYRAIRGRDLFGAPGAVVAEQRLKDAAEALERFADLVYQAREQGGGM